MSKCICNHRYIAQRNLPVANLTRTQILQSATCKTNNPYYKADTLEIKDGNL